MAKCKKIVIESTSYFLKAIKDTYTDVEIIAGGGIYDMSVYNKYKNLGANHYSISTLFLHPIKFSCFIYSFYNKKL